MISEECNKCEKLDACKFGRYINMVGGCGKFESKDHPVTGIHTSEETSEIMFEQVKKQ